MSKFVIEGGHKLSGEIIPQGAKNEALQVLCAVLLTPEKITMTNVPEIRDVLKLIDLLGDMGVEVKRTAKNSYTFKAENIKLEKLRTEDYHLKSTELRGSVMLVGPLLARFGQAFIPKPGGDKIGRRRLDTHFIGFQELGAKFHYDPRQSCYEVEASELAEHLVMVAGNVHDIHDSG